MKITSLLIAGLLMLASTATNAQSQGDFSGARLGTPAPQSQDANTLEKRRKLPAMQIRRDLRALEFSLRHRSGATVSLGPRGLSFSANF